MYNSIKSKTPTNAKLLFDALLIGKKRRLDECVQKGFLRLMLGKGAVTSLKTLAPTR
jgi:hypothetical protein